MIRSLRVLALVFLAVVATACAGLPNGRSAPAAPATFEEFSSAFCSSFTSLITAVGNPDSGSPSALSRLLDDAVARKDPIAAGRAAAAMIAELETGRQHAATAGRYVPAAQTMAQMDRLLVAFETSTVAKRDVAASVAGADPQAAFERAGGVAAWSAMLQGVAQVPIPVGAAPQPCRAFSGQV